MKIVKLKKVEVQHPPFLQERFGENYAQISVDITLKLKSSIKDVARVIHGHVPPYIEELTKKMPTPPQGVTDRDFVFGYEESGTWVPGIIETDAVLQEYVNHFPEEWKIVQRALGLARQKGRHACGFVIADKPISSFIPTQMISDYRCTQYDPASVEAAGGLKMDFLIVTVLTDIEDCIRSIHARSGRQIPEQVTIAGRRVPRIRLLPVQDGFVDIWDLPEDQEVFKDVSSGRTETVFQFNTSGARKWLEHFDYYTDETESRKAIDSIGAMAAFTALDRPGPLDAYIEGEGMRHNMLVEYARRMRGEPPIGTAPIFQELLPETKGIMAFQEQLQKMYQNLTGCTGSEAEEFRTFVAKKKMDKVQKAYDPWMQRVGAKLGEENARKIWDFFVSWGQYGFNLSHSVCYSVIGYACAYLKRHFPLEWWCAVLSNASKSKVNESHWRHVGGIVDLPEVSRSGEHYKIVGERIVAPITTLTGVADGALHQLLKYRPYSSILDFCQKKERHCIEGATPVLDATGAPVMVSKGRGKQKVQTPKIKRGKSALNRTICYKLIISGCLDSLFPKEMSTEDGTRMPVDVTDKLMMFEAAEAEVRGKRQQPVPSQYLVTDALVRFQMKKGLLPIYSEPLLGFIVKRQTPGIALRKSPTGRTLALYEWGGDSLPFVRPDKIKVLEEIEVLPEGEVIRVATPAYVVDLRRFQYAGKTKEAMSLTLDIEGVQMEVVKWPGRDGVLPDAFQEDLKGAVGVAVLKKYKEGKPFSLDDFVVVCPSLKKKESKDDEDQEDGSPVQTNSNEPVGDGAGSGGAAVS